MCAIAGALLGVVSSVVQGVGQAQAANYNAKLAEREAYRTRQLGAVQEASDRRESEFVLGQQKVDIAAAGRSGSTGTALEIALKSKLEDEIRHLGTRAGFQMRAEAKDAEKGLHKFNSRMSLLGAGFSAGARLLNMVPPHPALG